MISSSDFKKQIQKINQEKEVLEQRLLELRTYLKSDNDYTTEVTSALQLLTTLRNKLDNNPSYETRREIVKALVQRVQVHTIFDEYTKRPRASVTVQYTFSNDINHMGTGCKSQSAKTGPET